MNGLFFHFFYLFVLGNYQESLLYETMEQNFLPKENSKEKYLLFKSDLISEFHSLVSKISDIKSISEKIILNEFGRFLSTKLYEMSRGSIDPSWNYLQFLENIENTIHEALRNSNSSFNPPILKVTRISDNKVVMSYDSPRRLEYLALGIIQGFSRFFKDKYMVSMSKVDTPNSEISLFEISIANTAETTNAKEHSQNE
ncbi:hypothetical protein CH373_04945 [Leptospira perolatii]|uniref:Heme NO-binding domain-containing protein n=1 Tax=Leptospira perolatii TaxID=2023191 RepID=A0A2M9ZQA0_9LEPT|nr:heme NO-binding domain-containing protein [Leptospira perolatii]PJZ70424.1 hypothetical protein CH360_05365 [Leptospira perolatii]PJZ74260.1 hypothetical protein CH373_04945 [Leptospira perolatii]